MDAFDRDVLRHLAPLGTLRAAINFGNPVLAQRDPATGETSGVSVALARELGRCTGVPVELVPFEAAGKVVAALATDAWDVAFLAVDPERAAKIAFTAPYVIIEGTYLVRAESPLRGIDDVDRPGLRVCVGSRSAYDLHLTRTLEHATLVRAPTGSAALEQFLDGSLDVLAGIRQPLERAALQHPGLRVMPGRFMAIAQAIAVPRTRVHAAAYLDHFVDEVKASGFVAQALIASGQDAALVAPAAQRS